MDREEARQYIKTQLENYLQSKGINTRKPFTCLNPEHNDKHPSMSYDRKRNKAHCFSCGADYDTLDLIKIDTGLTGNELFLKAYDIFHIKLDTRGNQIKNQKQDKTEQITHTQLSIHNNTYTNKHTQQGEAGSMNKKDYTQYLEKCYHFIAETDYPQERGLSQDTINKYKIGYDNQFKTIDDKGNSVTWQALIIPTGKYTFVARNTDPEASDKNRYRKIGGSELYNRAALSRDQQPIFITEGEIDALSLIETGEEAIAIGSTANTNKLIEYIKDHKPSQPIILALDNDSAGQQAREKLAASLYELGIRYYVLTLPGSYKDINETLNKDREALTASITNVYNELNRGKEEAKGEYLKTAAASQLIRLMQDIQDSKKARYFPTGFNELDELLDGGLYAGLYIIGAISSLGKTTFVLQIADQIAQQGQDVLLFSLEMASNELMAKSISRHTLLEDLKRNNSTKHAKTTRGILTGSRYTNYDREDRDIINYAINAYGQYADHIFFHEGVGDIGIEKVKEVVANHIKITGNKPVVIIDYLQILAPYNERYTDKQNTDKAVLELKRLSRDNNIPIVGISSFNRENYTAPVNLTSFKESGAIEYSSDVLIGLQYEGMDYQGDEKEKDREKRVRALYKDMIAKGKNGEAQGIEVKVLKNRNGTKGSAGLDLYSMFNYFTDERAITATVTGWKKAESLYK